VLCSDGLTDMVHEDVIAAELRREPDPAVAAHKLVDRANAAGGVDNITVVVVAVNDGPSQSSAASSVELAPSVAEALLVDEPEPLRIDRSARRPRQARRVKTAIWVLAVLAVLGVAVRRSPGTRNTYYVGFDGNAVTVYKGCPAVCSCGTRPSTGATLSAATCAQPTPRQSPTGRPSRRSTAEAFVARAASTPLRPQPPARPRPRPRPRWRRADAPATTTIAGP
jgi:hypothetical protein